MRRYIYLTKEQVINCHHKIIRRFGGSNKLRDEGLLESALERPLNFAVYAAKEDVSIEKLASLYADAIIRSHPFIDGNKRTGFLLSVLFMQINGKEFKASEDDATKHVMALASNKLDYMQFYKFLKINS